jgi:hypothetical protein
MLSRDEVNNGRIFILKLHDASGVPFQWVQTLRGADAVRWYKIYRTSDWEALRREASQIFHSPVTAEEAERVRTARQRCVYIHTSLVKADELEAVQPTLLFEHKPDPGNALMRLEGP